MKRIILCTTPILLVVLTTLLFQLKDRWHEKERASIEQKPLGEENHNKGSQILKLDISKFRRVNINGVDCVVGYSVDSSSVSCDWKNKDNKQKNYPYHKDNW